MTDVVRSRRASVPLDRPLYARVLRLRHLAPSGFLCFVYLEGAFALGILLALAELVSWWGVLVLPAVVALMVKLNDVVAGLLARPAGRAARDGRARQTEKDARLGRAATGRGAAEEERNRRVGGAAPGSVPPEVIEGGPTTSHAWADQLDVREQMARQSAARRYE